MEVVLRGKHLDDEHRRQGEGYRADRKQNGRNNFHGFLEAASFHASYLPFMGGWLGSWFRCGTMLSMIEIIGWVVALTVIAAVVMYALGA